MNLNARTLAAIDKAQRHAAILKMLKRCRRDDSSSRYPVYNEQRLIASIDRMIRAGANREREGGTR